MDYKIVKKDVFNVVAKMKVIMDECGQQKIPEFWTEYFNEGLHEKVCGMMGICEQAKEEDGNWRYGIGCEEQYVNEVPEGFEVLEIPAHTWAIFKCVGPMPNAIQEMWQKIYSEWLPQANYELVNDYDIEFYTEGNNMDKDYVSEIWMPVKEK